MSEKNSTLNEVKKSVDVLIDLSKKDTKRTDRIEKTIEDLAVITKEGFDSMDERFNKIELDTKNIKAELEDIKLKFDNFAYSFEIKELRERVMVLEEKISNYEKSVK